MASVLSKGKLSVSKPQEPRRKGPTKARGQMRAGLLLTLPALIVMAATVVYPILWSLNISFLSSENYLAGSSQFVGLSNYARVLSSHQFQNARVLSSHQFQNALWNTGGFVVATIIIELIIGFAVALVLNQVLPGSKVFRVIFTFPLMIAPVVSGLQWRWLFADQYGVINYILAAIGVKGPLWLATAWGAKATILISNIWLATPFVILVLLAGLSSLPEELYEAARLDGARSDQIFRHITLPLLQPTLLLILVIRLSDAFRVFDIVYIITQGGPGGATEVLSTYIYKDTFTNLNFGVGAAGSFIVMIIIAIVSYASVRLLRPKEGGAK